MFLLIRKLKKLFVLIIGVLFVIFLYSSYDPPESLDENEMIYAGNWHGEENHNITIRQDGTGDYYLDGPSAEGGTVFIEEDTLTISVFFFDRIFNIEKEPKEVGEKTIMVLDGVEYIKE